MKTTVTTIYVFALAMASAVSTLGQTTVADFENLTLPAESYWNGSSGGNGFQSGDAFFPTDYYTPWAFWQGGSAYSNATDSVTAGFGNLYGVRAGSGFGGSDNFAVVQNDAVVRLLEGAVSVLGFYVTNGTYAARSMELGDDFGKQFGSPLNAAGVEDGTNGEDWFLLAISGHKDGNPTVASVEFYLADFRSANDENDFIVTDWQWVDISILGEVDSINFALSSSDVGDFGMNTPAFFILDNLTTENVEPTAIIAANASTGLQVFPNPSSGKVSISGIYQGQFVRITDVTGRVVAERVVQTEAMLNLDLSYLMAGTYLIEVSDQYSKMVSKLVRQ